MFRYFGAEGDGRAEHNQAGNELQVGLLGAELWLEPSGQGSFLVPELLVRVVGFGGGAG